MESIEPTGSAEIPWVLRAIAGQQCDVVSRQQLLDAGVSRQQLRSQVRARRWRIVGLAVVLHRGSPTPVQRSWIAYFQTRGRGVLVGHTALELAGLRGWLRDERHVVVPRGWRVARVPALVVHESRRFEATRDVARGAGPPRTNVARSAIDAAAWSRSRRTAAGLLAAVVQQRLCRPQDLAVELARAGRIRHVAVMRQTVRDIAGGADSLAEIDMARLVRRAGLPAPRRQSDRRDAAGRRRYIDLEVDLSDGTVLMIEVDGAHHLDVDQAWADQRRSNDLAGRRRVQLRFSSFAVRHEPDAVVASLRRFRQPLA